MKILIYGAGVIGSIFAAKLALSGQDVTVLARGKRLEELKENLSDLYKELTSGNIESIRRVGELEIK